MRFDGTSFIQDRDGHRLATQLARVREAMATGRDYTLSELAQAVGGTQAGVSARLRDLRKPRFGGHRVERRHIGCGLWAYRMEVKE